MVEGALEDRGVRVDGADDRAVPRGAAVAVAERGADAAEPQHADRDVGALLIRDAAHDGRAADVAHADEAADEARPGVEASRLLAHGDDREACGHVGGTRTAALPQQVVRGHVAVVMAELAEPLHAPAGGACGAMRLELYVCVWAGVGECECECVMTAAV